MITFSKVTLPRKGQLAFWGGAVAKGKTQIHFEVAWVFLQHQHVCFFSSNPVSKSKIAFASSRYPTNTSDSNCSSSYDVIDDEYTVFFIGIALSCHSVTHSVMFLRLDWCDPGVWSFTQPLLALPAVVNFDSHVVDIRQNKSHVVDASWKQCSAINASLNFHGGSVKSLPAV